MQEAIPGQAQRCHKSPFKNYGRGTPITYTNYTPIITLSLKGKHFIYLHRGHSVIAQRIAKQMCRKHATQRPGAGIQTATVVFCCMTSEAYLQKKIAQT